MNCVSTTAASEEIFQIAASISDKFIIGKRISEASKKLQNAIKLGKYKTDSGLITLTGLSGAGKTTFLRQFKHQHPELKILSLTVFHRDKVKDVGERILSLMSDPLSHKTSNKHCDITTQIQAQIKACGIDLIIIDESQHLKTNNGPVTNRILGNWMKQAAQIWGVPVLLAGLPDLDEMFNSDLQLRGRRLLNLKFGPYDWDVLEERNDWQKYLYEIEKFLPFTNPSNLYQPDCARKINQACTGLMRSSTQLLEAAVIAALLNERTFIANEDLESAFEAHRDNLESEMRNPFTS